jgi:hypothetical protein
MIVKDSGINSGLLKYVNNHGHKKFYNSGLWSSLVGLAWRSLFIILVLNLDEDIKCSKRNRIKSITICFYVWEECFEICIIFLGDTASPNGNVYTSVGNKIDFLKCFIKCSKRNRIKLIKMFFLCLTGMFRKLYNIFRNRQETKPLKYGSVCTSVGNNVDFLGGVFIHVHLVLK